MSCTFYYNTILLHVLYLLMGSPCWISSKSIKGLCCFHPGGHHQGGLGGGQQVGQRAVQLQVRYKILGCHPSLENLRYLDKGAMLSWSPRWTLSRGIRGRSACKSCRSTSSPEKSGISLWVPHGNTMPNLIQIHKGLCHFHPGGHHQWELVGGQQVCHKAVQLQVRYKIWGHHSQVDTVKGD